MKKYLNRIFAFFEKKRQQAEVRRAKKDILLGHGYCGISNRWIYCVIAKGNKEDVNWLLETTKDRYFYLLFLKNVLDAAKMLERNDIIKDLLTTCKERAEADGKFLRMSCNLLATYGDAEDFKWVRQNGKNVTFDKDFVSFFATYGSPLDVIWSLERAYQWTWECRSALSSILQESTLQKGTLKALTRLLRKRQDVRLATDEKLKLLSLDYNGFLPFVFFDDDKISSVATAPKIDVSLLKRYLASTEQLYKECKTLHILKQRIAIEEGSEIEAFDRSLWPFMLEAKQNLTSFIEKEVELELSPSYYRCTIFDTSNEFFETEEQKKLISRGKDDELTAYMTGYIKCLPDLISCKNSDTVKSYRNRFTEFVNLVLQSDATKQVKTSASQYLQKAHNICDNKLAIISRGGCGIAWLDGFEGDPLYSI